MIDRLDSNLPYLPSLVVSLRTLLAQGKSERIAVDGLDQLSLSCTITEVAANITGVGAILSVAAAVVRYLSK